MTDRKENSDLLSCWLLQNAKVNNKCIVNLSDELEIKSFLEINLGNRWVEACDYIVPDCHT